MSNIGFCSRDFALIPAKVLMSFKKNILSHSHSTKELHRLHSTIGPCPIKFEMIVIKKVRQNSSNYQKLVVNLDKKKVPNIKEVTADKL